MMMTLTASFVGPLEDGNLKSYLFSILVCCRIVVTSHQNARALSVYELLVARALATEMST
jgi:hypothetical protein